MLLLKASEKLSFYLCRSECLDVVQKPHENPPHFILKGLQLSMFTLVVKLRVQVLEKGVGESYSQPCRAWFSNGRMVGMIGEFWGGRGSWKEISGCPR